MPDTTFAPGTVITNRNRLWRVGAHQGDVFVATSIDGSQAEQVKFYVPFEDIRPGRLEPPAPALASPSASASPSSLNTYACATRACPASRPSSSIR
jgi:hypothetical protein